MKDEKILSNEELMEIEGGSKINLSSITKNIPFTVVAYAVTPFIPKFKNNLLC